jgi:hypothetical protein
MWIGNDLFAINIQDYGHRINASENALTGAIHQFYPTLKESTIAWVNLDVGGQKGIISNVQYPAVYPDLRLLIPRMPLVTKEQ